MTHRSQPGPGPRPISVRVVGGSDDGAERVRELLSKSAARSFDVSWVPAVDEALDPGAAAADVWLVAVSRDEPAGLEPLAQARLALPALPLVALGDEDDEDLAFEAFQAGASAYLLWDELGTRLLSTTLGGALESHRVIDELRAAQRRARHLATHDPLTGLANRSHFQERLERAVGHARSTGGRLAVLFVDLDRFKTINDNLGHGVGDGLLKGMARRMADCLGESDLAGRLGGDEFAVLLTELSSDLAAAQAAKKILGALGQPIPFRRQAPHTTASIGIASFPKDAADPEDLLRKADTAMYHAKERGRNRFEYYSERMGSVVIERAELETRLRDAILQDRLILFYQPQFDLLRGRILGAEALLRWNDEEKGIIAPEHFLDLAEETGLIVPIGERVLRSACRQTAAWQKLGFRGLRVSVNVASQQFQQRDFASVVRSALVESGLSPACLELEITESSLLRDVDVTVNTLRSLKELGVRLAIDDFGTGYSALSYLKRLPIDVLKIDQSFVSGLTTDPADATITASIVRMAQGLNLTTIAEGVETLEQLLLLGSYGCNRMQGFLFGAPVAPETFGEWLSDPPFRWVKGA